MTWTCEKCATRHETEEQRLTCKRMDRALIVTIWLALALIACVFVGMDVAWHQYAYGDWKCAWMNCVKVAK